MPGVHDSPWEHEEARVFPGNEQSPYNFGPFLPMTPHREAWLIVAREIAYAYTISSSRFNEKRTRKTRWSSRTAFAVLVLVVLVVSLLLSISMRFYGGFAASSHRMFDFAARRLDQREARNARNASSTRDRACIIKQWRGSITVRNLNGSNLITFISDTPLREVAFCSRSERVKFDLSSPPSH